MIGLSLWKGEIEIPKPFVTMASIIADVASRHQLKPSDLIGMSRLRPIAAARHEAMWLMRQEKRQDGFPKWSTLRIGAVLGGRHHTTIMHGSRRHRKGLGL